MKALLKILIFLSLCNNLKAEGYFIGTPYKKLTKCCKAEVNFLWFHFLKLGKDHRELLYTDIYYTNDLNDKFLGMSIKSLLLNKDYIVINKKMFEELPKYNRIALIAHEIGHLVYNLDHHDTYMTTGEPISIMHSVDFSIQSQKMFEYYMFEMFNRIKLTKKYK